MARALFPGLTIGGVNLLEAMVYGGMVLASIGVCAIYAVFILGNVPDLDTGHIKRWCGVVCFFGRVGPVRAHPLTRFPPTLGMWRSAARR